MNRNKHTVTLPIEDYEELIQKASRENDFEGLMQVKEDKIKGAVDALFNTNMFMRPHEKYIEPENIELFFRWKKVKP